MCNLIHLVRVNYFLSLGEFSVSGVRANKGAKGREDFLSALVALAAARLGVTSLQWPSFLPLLAD